MTTEEVLSRLRELGGLTSLSSLEKQEIEDLYPEVLGLKFQRTSCSDCYKDAVIRMYNYIKKHGKMKEKTDYKLKNGVLLQMNFGDTTFYNNTTLTDEIAEKYLAKYPQNINYFAEYPEDWEDRIAKKSASKINEELVNLMIEALSDGVSDDSLKEEFASYKISGRQISKRALDLHIKVAMERFALIEPAISDDAEGNDEEKPEESFEDAPNSEGLHEENVE